MFHVIIIGIFLSLLLKLNLLYSLLIHLIMYNKYYFKDEKELEYLLHLERNNKKKKKYKYTFLTDLLNITIPYISVIGTILLIAFLI